MRGVGAELPWLPVLGALIADTPDSSLWSAAYLVRLAHVFLYRKS